MNEMAERIERHFRSARESSIAISHELRSPLTRMNIALEFIQNEKIRISMKEEIELLDRLTANILEKERMDSRPDSLHLEDTNLIQFLESVVSPYPERVELITPNQISLFPLDTTQMALCLRNLIENGLKFSDKTVTVKLTNNDEAFFISIIDRGQGISKGDIPHVTEAFFRSDSSRTGVRSKTGGGFGLGLSLCQSIIQAHGGTLEIESELGIGTEIKVRIQR